MNNKPKKVLNIKDDIKKSIRTIPNWPKRGIMFRDITTLLTDPIMFSCTIDILYEKYKDSKIDAIVGIESRGFIFASVLAHKMKKKLVLIRKKGKLPYKTVSETYMKEYGPDTIEMHEDALKKGERVLIVDDLIATGGTALASARLVEKMKANVYEIAFVIGLPDLISKEIKSKYKIFTIIDFEGE